MSNLKLSLADQGSIGPIGVVAVPIHEPKADNAEVMFADANLEVAIREAIDISDGSDNSAE